MTTFELKPAVFAFCFACETIRDLREHDLMLGASIFPPVRSTSPEAVYRRYSQQKWKEQT